MSTAFGSCAIMANIDDGGMIMYGGAPDINEVSGDDRNPSPPLSPQSAQQQQLNQQQQQHGGRGHQGQTSARYKTEQCRAFTEKGMCKYGTKCQVCM
jgi:hypothetical protein